MKVKKKCFFYLQDKSTIFGRKKIFHLMLVISNKLLSLHPVKQEQ